MIILYIIFAFLFIYPTIGAVHAKKQFSNQLAKWQAIPEKEKSDTRANEINLALKNMTHDICNLQKYGNGEYRYPFLASKGCDCKNSKEYWALKRELENTPRLPRPEPSLRPVFSWPAQMLISYVGSSDEDIKKTKELAAAQHRVELARLAYEEDQYLTKQLGS